MIAYLSAVRKMSLEANCHIYQKVLWILEEDILLLGIYQNWIEQKKNTHTGLEITQSLFLDMPTPIAEAMASSLLNFWSIPVALREILSSNMKLQQRLKSAQPPPVICLEADMQSRLGSRSD